MKKMVRIIFFLCVMVVAMQPRASAQDKEVMAQYQSELSQLFEQVFTAPTDNERYHANESVIGLLSEALAVENSFRWQWDLSLASRRASPRMGGMTMRKENCASFSFLLPSNRPVAMVLPERESPGRTAAAWAIPITKACQREMLSR